MHTVICWGEDEDRSGAETGLAGISDPVTTVVSGDTVRLPTKYPYIALAYIGTEFAAYWPIRYRLTSPSITQTPLVLSRGLFAGVQGWPGGVYDWRDEPYGKIPVGEDITAYSYEEDEAGVAHKNSIGLVISDGVIPTVQPKRGLILHHCTPAAAIAAALTWQEITLTETYALKAGKYKMWGADLVSASVIGARFVFPGNNQVGRPAIIPRRQENYPIHPFSLNWGVGIEFEIPGGLPILDMVCETTDTADHISLLLEKVG